MPGVVGGVLDTWASWIQWAVGGVVAGIVMLWSAIARKQRAQLNRQESDKAELEERLFKIENRMAVLAPANCVVHSERLARVEEKLQLVPTHEDLKEVSGRVDNLSTNLSYIKGSVSRMEPLLDNVNRILLERRAK